MHESILSGPVLLPHTRDQKRLGGESRFEQEASYSHHSGAQLPGLCTVQDALRLTHNSSWIKKIYAVDLSVLCFRVLV